jgi:hypothetical protein
MWRLLLLLVLLSIPIGPGSLAAWSGTTADQVISWDDNEYARGVQLLLDEDSVILHAFWGEDAPTVRELHYGRSTDLGATWSSSLADRVISFPDGNALFEEPDVATVLGGPLIVVWSEDLDTAREVHYGVSLDQGATFSCESADLVLSDPSTAVDSGIPSIVIDQDQNFHVVWQQVVGGAAEVHYSRSTDGGATWSGTSGDRIISYPDGNGAITPQIVLGADGRLIVVWRETGDSGFPTIHVGMSDDGGDTWTSESADREISQPARLMTNLAAASLPYYMTADGQIYVVYTASFDTSSPYHYEVYLTSSSDNGNTWSGETADTIISYDEDHTRSAHSPDVFYSACGGAIAAWDEVEESTGTNEQHISQYNGVSWTGAAADEIISYPDGENGYRPSIAGVQSIVILPDREGSGMTRQDLPDTWVAWTEFTGGTTDNYEVHLSSTQRCSATSVESPNAEASLRVRAVPNPSRSGFRLELDTVVSAGPIRVQIFDAAGRCLRVIDGDLDGAGRAEVFWDARNEAGRPLPAGLYRARVRTASGARTVPLVLF